MEHRNNNRYVDVIEDLLEGYNNTPHSRHGGVPASIGDKGDMQRLWRQKFERETPKRYNRLLKLETMFAWLDQEGCLRMSTMRDGQERCLL